MRGRLEPYPSEAPQPPPATSNDTVALDSLRVLLVEDEPDTLEYLQRLLKDHGGIVFTARSAPGGTGDCSVANAWRCSSATSGCRKWTATT